MYNSVEINVEKFFNLLNVCIALLQRTHCDSNYNYSVPGGGKSGLLVVLHASRDANPQQQERKQLGEHALGHLSTFLTTAQDSNGLGGLETNAG